jgi:hypothetical protein
MKRCWEIESTSVRIIADNFDLHRVPDIVIYKRGAVLPEINLRHGHRAQAINWKNYKTSVYNCVYCIQKENAFSILKISSSRYLFAYHPKYLDKTEVEQIVFELFIENNI